jgi:hypothetical protein
MTLYTSTLSPKGNSSVTPLYERQYDLYDSISTLDEPSKDDVYDTKKKHDDRNFVNAMHHPDIDIGRP